MKSIYFFLFFLLILRVSFTFWFESKYKPGDQLSLDLTLDREPEIVNGKQLLKVGELMVFAPVIPELHFGDQIKISGSIECSLRGQDCSRLGIYRPDIKIIGPASLNPWIITSFTIRSRFVNIYQTILPRDQASLLSGVVLGNLGLDREFKNKLANVGLTHIVAASGMNVSLFSGFVLWMLSIVNLRKIYKVVLAIVMISFYSTITGFEPPIVRAALMAGFSLVGVLLGRQRSGLMGLFLSGYIMLWVSPKLLVSASFLLTFAAMMGQVFLSSLNVHLTKILSLVLENFLQSLMAIVFTFPIVLMFFAKFSLISLFTNALVLWTVEPLMILGAIAGILGMISNTLAQWVALPTGVLLSFFLWVVNLFGEDPKWLLRVSGIGWTFSFGYYLILGAAIWWWRQQSDRIAAAK